VIQVFCHLIGDYFLQSDWMATNKKKHWWPAIKHSLFYSVPFLLVTRHPLALFVIFSTHLVIDHFDFLKYLNMLKNGMLRTRFTGDGGAWDRDIPENKMGYSLDRPDHIVHWLVIIQDNTLHLILNYLAIRFL